MPVFGVYKDFDAVSLSSIICRSNRWRVVAR